MNRYGVLVFYDSEGVVGNYVLELLNSLRTILKKTVIIINGVINENERIKLNQYTKYIFQRENFGFDGGAYKDAFLNFLKFEKWENYDEIYLINDTFYGPFLPWDDFIGIMENQNYDFWGLSRHPGIKGDYRAGIEIVEHIQSYFICITKSIFLTPFFNDFWEKMDYPVSYNDAVGKFEISFSKYFVEHGFALGSLCDVLFEKFNIKEDFLHFDMAALITELHFPVLKRKYISINRYLSLKSIFSYLEDETDYPVEVIRKDVNRKIENRLLKPYCPVKLVEFCQKFKSLYIYGNGQHALNIKEYLMDQGFQVDGHIVTNILKPEKKVYSIEKFVLPEDAAIIVALGEKNLSEVSGFLKSKFDNCHIFLPEYAWQE